ncbi:MAG: hypothetical protein AB1601_06280 [Planctomycetota bacterium]
MGTTRTRHLGRLALTAALLLALPAWGQAPAGERRGRRPPPPPPPEGTAATQPAPDGRPLWGQGPPSPGHRGPGWELGRHLFRLLPEDRRPLAPGEDEELLAFVRQHMPRLAEALERLRERDPDRFRARLSEQAPRLRHLRRIHELSPRLSEIVRQHAENMLQVHRTLRSLRNVAPTTAEAALLEQQARQRLTDAVRLEIEALSVMAAALEQHQAERVAERTASWLADDADLTDAPDEARTAVAAYRGAGTDVARDAARVTLEQAATAQVANEIAGLRGQAQRMETNVPAEVDRRLTELREPRPPRTRERGRFSAPQ